MQYIHLFLAVFLILQFIFTVHTSRVESEKETPGAQVPIYRIELAIARWKELEKPTRSTSVAGRNHLAFVLILVW